jgi:hypothetical protein
VRLNIQLPGPFTTSTEVNGKRTGQGCMGLVIVFVGLLLLCCCAGTVAETYDRLTGKDTITTEGVTP